MGRLAALHCVLPWTLALLLGMAAAAADEGPRLEMFDLAHRPAAELASIIAPLLDQDEAVQASGFQLIVRARPDTLEQVRDLLQRLDRAPRQLLISVRQPSRLHSAEREAAAQTEATDQALRGRVRIHGTESRSRAGAAQQIRVLEGNAAFIQAGQSVPIGERNVSIGPGGALVQDTTRYRDVTSGFYVVPRVTGEDVILDISAHRDTLNRHGGGVIDTRQAVTTVRGRLGQWIELGGSGERLADDQRGILYRSGERGESAGRIELRVQAVD